MKPREEKHHIQKEKKLLRKKQKTYWGEEGPLRKGDMEKGNLKRTQDRFEETESGKRKMLTSG